MARTGMRPRWHLYRDDRLAVDSQGEPRVFSSEAEALWAGRNWVEFRLPTTAELASLSEGDLRAERVAKGSGRVDEGV